jgi:uracil-DNA glycosylase family 4
VDINKEYEILVKEIMSCTKCPLHKSRKNPVPGEGPLDANIMIVGEAPGRHEDEVGRPFVGPAGKLLDYLLEIAGLKREEVFITNVVKCRPPKNRDPRPEEINACLPYLIRQIKLIRPSIILALGRISGSTLYKLIKRKWRGMTTEHGVPVEGTIDGIKLIIIPTYHPAAALYKPELKRILEEDFKGVIREYVNKIKKKEKISNRRRTLLDFM